MNNKRFSLKPLVWAALLLAPVWAAYHMAADDGRVTAEQKGSSMAIKATAARAEAVIPLLDAQAPPATQTATFALG